MAALMQSKISSHAGLLIVGNSNHIAAMKSLVRSSTSSSVSCECSLLSVAGVSIVKFTISTSVKFAPAPDLNRTLVLSLTVDLLDASANAPRCRLPSCNLNPRLRSRVYTTSRWQIRVGQRTSSLPLPSGCEPDNTRFGFAFFLDRPLPRGGDLNPQLRRHGR